MKINLKSKKAQKRISRSIESIVALSLLVTIVLSMLILYLYNSTKSWKHSKLNTAYADAPAEFVSNQVSEDIVGDIEILSSIQNELTKIEKNGDITSKSQKIYDSANSVLQKLKIDSGESYENTERLKTYIEINNFVNSAYKEPNADKLRDLISKQTRQVLDHDRDIDKKFLNKLDSVVQNYIKVNEFITNVLPALGNVKDDSLIVHNSVTTLGEFDAKISEVSIFPKMEELRKLIKKDIDKILDNNKELQEQLEWLKAKTKLDGLKGDYVHLSDIKTIKDAKERGYEIIDLDQKDDQELQDDSLIKSFHYEGNEIPSSHYALKTLKLQVKVDAKWKKKETKERGNNKNNTSNKEDDNASFVDRLTRATDPSQNQNERNRENNNTPLVNP